MINKLIRSNSDTNFFFNNENINLINRNVTNLKTRSLTNNYTQETLINQDINITKVQNKTSLILNCNYML